MGMTEKRFTIHGDVVSDTDMKIPITVWSDKKQQKKFCDELNALHEENEQLKRINKRCSDNHLRMRNRLERLNKDWDKIYDICKDKGMTDEEIIKEMER